LTGGEFDPALMMTAKIHTKDGDWSRAKQVLASYSTKLPGDQAANDMLYDISEAETAASKAGKARRAQLRVVCSEAATQALRVASHSFELRQTRADGNLAGGDVQGAVLDLT
jgi:DnaJ homolog subfamily C member 3